MDAYRLGIELRAESSHPKPTNQPFPPPPLAGTEGIRPLDSPEALAAEAADMMHCLANGAWESDARQRQGYGYAVEAGGQRGTLWIRRDRDAPTGFQLSQLSGPGNAPPAPPVVQLVEAWMARTEASLPERWQSQLPSRIRVFPDWYHADDDCSF